MSYQSVIAALPGAVSHWLLGETSGTNAADSIGGSNGTYTGSPTLNVTSPAGLTPGISVTGGSRVVIPASANFDFGSGEYWVAFWFKTTQSAGTIVVAGNAGTGRWIEVNNGKVRVNHGPFIETPAGYNDGNWHCAVITRVGNTCNIYMDGSTTAAGTGGVSGWSMKLGDGSTTWGFGASQPGDYAFVGSLDGLAIGKGTGLDATTAATIYTAGSSAGSFTLSPTTIAAGSTSNAITLTGSGTSWTAGTPGSPTFTLSGGTGASITAQSVASTTSATITVNAGSATGTLTITDPSTGATQTITVAAASATAFTLTGPSSGTVNAASTNFTFTPNGLYTGTITPSMAGLAGSWTPSSLSWTSASDAKTATFTPTAIGTGNANGTGSPALTQPSNVSYTSNAGALVAGSITLSSSSPSGPVLTIANGTGGTPTLTHYLHRSAAGKYFTPSGTSPGTGTCIAVNPSSPYTDSTLAQGNGAWYLLRTIDGASASVDSGYTAASTYSGAIRIGGIGDSRMANGGLQGLADILTRNGWARVVTVSNQGVSGSDSNGWAPGSSNYNAAVSAFNAAGVTHIVMDLGTNDAGNGVSAATYLTRMNLIFASIWSAVPTLQKVYISYQTQEILPAGSEAANIANNGRLQAYQAQINSIAAADPTRVKVIGKSLYGLTSVIPGFLNSDGVHESSTGLLAKSYVWANDIIADLAGAGGPGGVPMIGSSTLIRGLN